ncbi:MAG: hypothetical protein K5696_03745 [Lachnospiraceae bacterium]|nr:hypothetical protein [Lachnospiraceae bacterium]
MSPFCFNLLFPLLLLLWPFVSVTQGVDVSDTTYALSNYTYLESIDPMWLLATWLPNVLGAALIRLPGGDSLRGMNFLCSLFVSATAEVAYFGLRGLRIRSAADASSSDSFAPFSPGLLFVSLWIAENLFWCPAVILYNTLTYFLMTVAGVLLLHGFACPRETDHKAGVNRKRFFFYLSAGLCLGLNVFVRFPNAVETLFIAAVILCHAVAVRRKPAAGVLLRDLAACIVGYLIALIISLVIISLSSDSSYLNMITELLAMTDGAQDYTAAGMISSILNAYATTCRELLPAVFLLAAGFLILTGADAFSESKGGSRRLLTEARILAVLLIAVLFGLYYTSGIYTRNYHYYDCMFEPVMILIILAILLAVAGMTPVLWAKSGTDGFPAAFGRPAACLLLLFILITPIGSNNYTFPIVNNLFLILPLAFLLLKRASSALNNRSRIAAGAGASALRAGRFLLLAWAGALVLLVLVQGSLFHLCFVFGDAGDENGRSAVITELPRARGMHTSADNARSLEELRQQIDAAYPGASGQKALIFGDAPGLHYLLELPPALFTSWPDLNSNGTARVHQALDALRDSKERPFVLLRQDMRLYPTTDGFSSEEKGRLILDYLTESGYNKLFEVDGGSGVIYRGFGG